jgi:hypothetical protein
MRQNPSTPKGCRCGVYMISQTATDILRAASPLNYRKPVVSRRIDEDANLSNLPC